MMDPSRSGIYEAVRLHRCD